MAVIDLSSFNSNRQPHGLLGEVPVWLRIELDATEVDNASDDLLLFKFPDTCYLPNRAGSVVLEFETAVDSGGATWQYDLVVSGADAVADYTLDANATAGRADADVAYSDAIATAPALIDVGGLYLALNIDAVGDQDGVVNAYFRYVTNISQLVRDNPA